MTNIFYSGDDIEITVSADTSVSGVNEITVNLVRDKAPDTAVLAKTMTGSGVSLVDSTSFKVIITDTESALLSGVYLIQAVVEDAAGKFGTLNIDEPVLELQTRA